MKKDSTKNDKKKSNKKTSDKKGKKSKGKKKKKVQFSNEKTTVETNNMVDEEFEHARKETDLELLKKQAAAELQRLAEQNDNLYHENEVLKLKYDDLQHEIESINKSKESDDLYKDENERLKLIIENYKSETVTLQTEIVMLTELINEHKKTQSDNEIVNNEIETQNEPNELQIDKMDAIKKLITEKNDILIEYEELKILYDKATKDITNYKKEINTMSTEINTMTTELAGERQLNFQHNKVQMNKINNLNKKMELSKDELLLEYEQKEQQFIQTVEEQLKYIDELENENQAFQKHHTRKVSLDNASGNGMYSLLRMKTQVDIFGNDGGKANNFFEEFDDENNDSVSFEFDENNDIYSPISVISPVETFIEHGVEDVGNTLLVSMNSQMNMDSYDTMSTYLDRLQSSEKNKEQMLLEKTEREKLEKESESIEKQKQEREKILAEQKQQTKLNEIKIEYTVNKNIPIEQTLIRQLGYFINKNGKLLPLSKENKEENKDENSEEKNSEDDIGLMSFGLDEHIYTQLTSAITIYLFDTLLKYYKFRPKQIGKVSKRVNKKKQVMQIDYQYKTLLFSSNFNKIDTLFIIIPPYRGGICYWNLCIDKGIVYGTLLSYIEFALALNNIKDKNKKKCGVLLLDPKGLDTNATPWSIFKIYDKFISKKVQHKKIKNIVFIGALKEGNLISHLLDRRGKELKSVVKSCIFLGCDDPYTARKHTAEIYEKCAVNFINSINKIGVDEVGTKSNGDKYYIPRKSSGMSSFCAISAYQKVIETIKIALDIKDE